MFQVAGQEWGSEVVISTRLNAGEALFLPGGTYHIPGGGQPEASIMMGFKLLDAPLSRRQAAARAAAERGAVPSRVKAAHIARLADEADPVAPVSGDGYRFEGDWWCLAPESAECAMNGAVRGTEII